MDSLPEDLWAIVLARLPLKTITASKLVCKQWKSIVESPFFRDLFMSLHQNSPSSSWSLMCSFLMSPEFVAHYQCETWGLKRSLGSFISSILTKLNGKYYQPARVEAYSDVGLIFIHVPPLKGKGSLYVANPVSRECVEVFLPVGVETDEGLWTLGIVTRTEKGVVLGYKVVMFDGRPIKTTNLTFLIYSSETGLWSHDTFHLPYSVTYPGFNEPFSLNGNLHWLNQNNANDIVLSIDFYATGTGSDRCRATPFPDLGKTTKFRRACTASQGFVMYMNIVSVTDGSHLEDKLCVWRLQSEGWQLVSEISPDFILTGFDYFPLTINPFDAKTAYFWSKEQQRLLSINLHNGKFVLHNRLEHSKFGRIMFPVNDHRAMISIKGPGEMKYIKKIRLSSFVFPQWLHRIPNTETRRERSGIGTMSRGGT